MLLCTRPIRHLFLLIDMWILYAYLYFSSFIILRAIAYFPGVAGFFPPFSQGTSIELMIGDLMGKSLVATVDALDPIVK